MCIPTFTSIEEARGFLIFQIWWVIGFLSHMFSGDESTSELPLAIFYMALGPLNIIRIMVKKAISAISNKAISKNKECTYTKWDTYYEKEDETTFVVYKTRHKRPNWWPKNISSPGYKETIKLATIYASLQERYVLGHHLTGYYIDHIEWNEETSIKFTDMLKVRKIENFIERHELYLTDWT